MSIKNVTIREFNEQISRVKRNWSGIVVHHFASPKASQYRGKATWDSVKNYHVRSQGWSDIGYHVGVGPDNSIWLLRSRDGGGEKGYLEAFGAHTVGHNGTKLGVVLAGDFDTEDPKKNGYSTLVNVIALLCDRFDISVNQVYGHRQFANKSCPGKNINITELRNDVAKFVGGKVVDDDREPELPEIAVVIGSSYVDCNPIMIDGEIYGRVRDIYNSAAWDVHYKKQEYKGKTLHRVYPKDRAWEE